MGEREVKCFSGVETSQNRKMEGGIERKKNTKL